MKRNQVLMAFLFCIPVLPVFAQTRGEIKQNKIKSVTVKVEDVNQKTQIEEIRKYDSNGNLISEEQFSKKGSIKKKRERTYNRNSDITEERNYNEKGELTEITSTTFKFELPVLVEVKDASGQVIRKTEVNYNAREEKIEEINYNGQLELVSKSVYTYDKKGLRTTKKTYDAAGTLIESKTYEYEF